MAAALLSNAVYCESCATDFLAFTDCLGSIDAAFDTYDPIGNEFSLIAAARIACTAYAVTLTADQGALRVPKSYRQAMSSPQAEPWRARRGCSRAFTFTLYSAPILEIIRR